jgi:class 3 adenylate cyclase
MGSFMTSSDAMRAAVLAHERFGKLVYERVGTLRIKMGIHTGSVITVNMNNRIDYFGNTVNTAARIESNALDHSVCFSREVFEQAGVKRFLKQKQDELGAQITHRTVALKGITDHFDLYALRIEPPTLISF